MTTSIHLDDITCRNELRPGDLGYIAYLHGQIYAKECGYGLGFEGYVLQGLQEFAHQYDPDRDKVWICEHNNIIVGFLLGFHRPDSLQLRYFILLPDYRGIGLGKKLIIEFLAFMKQRQYTRAYLWTTNEQLAAASLYTRHGFRLIEEKISDAFDKQLIERKYELEIPRN
jgi:ribosomal protein S18 acetylase RimI-like enzyme